MLLDEQHHLTYYLVYCIMYLLSTIYFYQFISSQLNVLKTHANSGLDNGFCYKNIWPPELRVGVMYSVYSVYTVQCPLYSQLLSRDWAEPELAVQWATSLSRQQCQCKVPNYLLCCVNSVTVLQSYPPHRSVSHCQLFSFVKIKYPSDFKCYYLIKDMYIVHGKPKKCDPC